MRAILSPPDGEEGRPTQGDGQLGGEGAGVVENVLCRVASSLHTQAEFGPPFSRFILFRAESELFAFFGGEREVGMGERDDFDFEAEAGEAQMVICTHAEQHTDACGQSGQQVVNQEDTGLLVEHLQVVEGDGQGRVLGEITPKGGGGTEWGKGMALSVCELTVQGLGQLSGELGSDIEGVAASVSCGEVQATVLDRVLEERCFAVTAWGDERHDLGGWGVEALKERWPGDSFHG